MESVYLISLIVGGFFVLLSVLGGADSDADVDVDLDIDADFDFDADTDFDADGGVDLDGVGHGYGSDIGVVDLLSIRTLFLFAAFFGLTGVLLNFFGGSEPATTVFATLTGLTVGVGGNYLIKKFAYQSVSSEVTEQNMRGKTGRVILPFGKEDTGKILIEAKGKRMQLLARSLDNTVQESFDQGEEVVIVRIDGRIAEVVKPT